MKRKDRKIRVVTSDKPDPAAHTHLGPRMAHPFAKPITKGSLRPFAVDNVRRGQRGGGFGRH